MGRLNRLEFLSWFAICTISGLAILWFVSGELLYGNVMLLTALFPTCARLHDIGCSGWWSLFPGALLTLAGEGLEKGGLVEPAICGIPGLLLIGVIASIPGQAGRNRYGEPPLRGSLI